MINKIFPLLGLCFLFSFLTIQGQTEAADSIPKPCFLALDTLDEFDSTRMIATLPMKIGFMVPTKNIAEDFGGKNLTDEAKVVFSYAESTDNIRSFFLSLVVVEHQFLNIKNGSNVYFKLENGQLINIYNVTDRAELNKEIIMWMYQHTLVIPLEVYHILKNERVAKIRVNYEGYKRTITLEPDQRQALQDAVRCVNERLRKNVSKP
ncbi:MAG: hypothetical protein ACI9XO_003828 [Paraglaciecola sp.]|jgi:hypothetical protein